MEQHCAQTHLHPPPPLAFTSAARCFKVPDTPPLTPLEFIPTPRTPRKPAHPSQTASSSSVDRGNSAIISFKLVQASGQRSPSLQITSTAPSKRQVSTARRRLWVQPGDTCEPFTMDAVPRAGLKDSASPKRSIYMEGVDDADDEMEGNSPISYFSPPYSPGYEDTISEAAAKPSSSSYPNEAKEKRSAHFISPKVRPPSKSKTCASCKTKKTPLWRDSEDGTPYCNACGIRFKKYRFRCSACSYIPRKDEREVSKSCCLCGSRLVHCKVNGRY